MKALRMGRASLVDVGEINGEAWLYGANIPLLFPQGSMD